MNFLDRALSIVAPGTALQRARNRAALSILNGATARYDAATPGARGKSWNPTASDADAAAAGQRSRLAFVARDMIRNTAFAVRAQQVIVNNVVGDGIIPKVVAPDQATRDALLSVIEEHLDTTAIDATGRNNLYGLQRLAMNTVVDSGEVIIRRRMRFRSDGYALPFQIEVLEPDHLDTSLSGRLRDGGQVIEGIEYDQLGRRVAYYLFKDHPGAYGYRSSRDTSRVPASEIQHVFRQDRPGQKRGVSWLAPIAMHLQDMADHQDAQLMRQKIAACFAAFRVSLDGEPLDGEAAGLSGNLIPGRIQQLAPGEDIRFAAPPGVESYDEFTRSVLRAVAAGLGVTYEALTGDLSNVNFSSARMGRMEMDRNISSWQWTMLIPQMMQPIGKWIIDDWMLMQRRRISGVKLDWVPPHRILVDPTREIPALANKVRAGFASRSGVVRELGYDPERLIQEIKQDNDQADQLGLVFQSDARRSSATGIRQNPDINDGDEE